jgi:hypothetical protein
MLAPRVRRSRSTVGERRRDADSDGHHDVKDTEHWLASPKREVFGPLGVTNIRTFVSPDDSRKVAVLMDIPDMDAVMSFMQTQEAADAMAFDGVVPKTLVLLVEQRPA